MQPDIPSLLTQLLSSDIFNENSCILQCFKYIVDEGLIPVPDDMKAGQKPEEKEVKDKSLDYADQVESTDESESSSSGSTSESSDSDSGSSDSDSGSSDSESSDSSSSSDSNSPDPSVVSDNEPDPPQESVTNQLIDLVDLIVYYKPTIVTNP